MSDTLNLSALVKSAMADIISAHGLSLVEAANNEVILKSDLYALDVYADRDGVSMVYFDTASKPVVGYNVLLFLINRRRSSLTFSKSELESSNYAEFIQSGLNGLARHLRSAGGDILTGSKDWIKGYSWPPVRPTGVVAGLI